MRHSSSVLGDTNSLIYETQISAEVVTRRARARARRLDISCPAGRREQVASVASVKHESSEECSKLRN